MILKNIQDFIDITPICEFCGESLITRLVGDVKGAVYPRYNMNFTQTIFKSEADMMFDDMMSEVKKKYGDDVQYSSMEDDENVHFCYEIGPIKRIVLSINKQTNAVSNIHLDNAQKVFWDNKLTVMRHCNSEQCKKPHQGYIGKSSQLMLERRTKSICPFIMGMEAMTITLKESSYALTSMYTQQKTYLIATKKADFIGNLPFMQLHKLKGADTIVNKIKTIIMFS